MKNNPLCICGHRKLFHLHQYISGRQVECKWYEDDDDFFCECGKFKLDNLSYIEELAESKGLV
jgi:hypothetical protein